MLIQQLQLKPQPKPDSVLDAKTLLTFDRASDHSLYSFLLGMGSQESMLLTHWFGTTNV